MNNEPRETLAAILQEWIDAENEWRNGGEEKPASVAFSKIMSLIEQERIAGAEELASNVKDKISPMKQVREVYCPKEDKRVKEYFSHHDLDHYCEDCGTKLKERTVMEIDYSQYPERYELEEFIDTALQSMKGTGEGGCVE